MNRPSAYNGKEPYLFISYSHRDSQRVLPIIQSLQDKGFRVWYDEGIEVGSHWGEAIASHLLDCTSAVCFLSKEFLASSNCQDEMHFAKEEGKGPLIVYLDEVQLPPVMRLQYGRLHALSLNKFPSQENFLENLAANHLLAPCFGGRASSPPASAPASAPASTPAAPARNSLFKRGSSSGKSGDDWFREGENHYYGKNGCTKDYAQAARCYREGAQLDHRSSQFSLGWCYEFGQGVEKDKEKAVQLYRKAADNGHAEACYRIGRYYNFEKNDKRESVRWYTMAAERGNAAAMNDLAIRYERGEGVEKNPQKAFQWYQKAAEKGNVMAQTNMGVCYGTGLGVAQDYAEAAKWYQKAAEAGSASAQHFLATYYSKGRGVEQNLEQAAYWYRKSAEQGHAVSQYNMGLYYKQGKGVPQSYSEAVKWFQKAADQGDEDAKRLLEECKAKL